MMLQVPQTMSLSGIGLGDCCTPVLDDQGAVASLDCSGCPPSSGGSIPDTFSGSGGGTSSSTAGLTAAQIAQMVTQAGSVAAQAFNAANAPAGYVYNAATNQYTKAGATTAPPGFSYNPSTGQYVASSTVSASGIMPLVIGGVAILALMLVLKK